MVAEQVSASNLEIDGLDPSLNTKNQQASTRKGAFLLPLFWWARLLFSRAGRAHLQPFLRGYNIHSLKGVATMTEKISTVTIAGKEYPKMHMDHMKRAQIKSLKPLLAKLNDEQDLELAWDIIPVVFHGVSQEDADELTIGECKAILSDAGIATFEDPAKNKAVAVADEGITVGESSDSTNS